MTDLDRLEQAHAAATPGEWEANYWDVDCESGAIGSFSMKQDATFTALAHNELPTLIAELRQLRAERDRLREALEWYEEQVQNCRKLTGHDARSALDRDGGKRARAALGGEHE
jgi:hypothetical protein